MKKFILVAFIAIILSFSFQTLTGAEASNFKEIKTIANLLNEENLSIEKWQVIVKEQISEDQFSTVKQTIQELNPNSSFEKTDTENATKFVLDSQKDDFFSESFVVIVPKDNNHASYHLVYTVTGSKWSEKVNEIASDRMATITKDLFTENLTKFSCVETKPNGNISSVYLIEKFTENLNVQTLDNIKEEDFTVLSGYTPQWETVIPTSDKPMNIQLASRTGLGGKTTLTIGTPIITTEY